MINFRTRKLRENDRWVLNGEKCGKIWGGFLSGINERTVIARRIFLTDIFFCKTNIFFFDWHIGNKKQSLISSTQTAVHILSVSKNSVLQSVFGQLLIIHQYPFYTMLFIWGRLSECLEQQRDFLVKCSLLWKTLL